MRGKKSKLMEIIKKNEMKRDCYYYNWNDNENFGSYFKKYGARCEYHDTFFSRNYCNMIEPSCYQCDYYQKRDD